jgi:ABC-2 type transport system ATP-binding protein
VTDRVIEVRGLRKDYGGVAAVRDVDLHVDRGEVFALLGPNGAGKTTTTEILEGYRTRSAGEVSVLGSDPADGDRRAKERIGVVLQSSGLDMFLTAHETVDLYAGYYPRPRDGDEVLEVVGLTDKRDAKVGTLSGGQRRRLDVAIALAGDPELLFLDEPTTGFDPNARRNAWEVVRSLVRLGKTVFLTTHFMDEAQALADRVAVIARGEIVAEGTPDTLAGRERRHARIRFRLPVGAPRIPDRGAQALPDGSFVLQTDDPTTAVHRLTGDALERGFAFEVLEVTMPSLEDVYLELTDDGTSSS